MATVQVLLARADACREYRKGERSPLRCRLSYRTERRLLTLAIRTLDQREYVVAKCEGLSVFVGVGS